MTATTIYNDGRLKSKCIRNYWFAIFEYLNMYCWSM